MPKKSIHVGRSADEIEADEIISGGNISGSSASMAEAAVSSDLVLAKIYQENVCSTQTTYKLEILNEGCEVLYSS